MAAGSDARYGSGMGGGEGLQRYEQAIAGFDRRVQMITDEQWTLPTPCTEWDVRALVHHLVYECRWAPPLMAGATPDEVGDAFEGDLLGADPKRAWGEAVAEARTAFAPDGALERTVHLSFGDVPGSEYLDQMTTDLVVHTWDLAKAIGHDDELDPALVAWVWKVWSDREEMVRNSGVFGAQVPVPDGADQQTELLAFFGRRRDWRP